VNCILVDKYNIRKETFIFNNNGNIMIFETVIFSNTANIIAPLICRYTVEKWFCMQNYIMNMNEEGYKNNL